MEKIKRGQIESWYDHKNIFITGATGFMGKVLLEKVLRSLPNVGKLYILVRPKYGVSSQERINKIFKQLPLFETLRENHPESLKKIQPLTGDITEENMGLTSAQLEELKKEVSIVINLGATLKLEADLKTSIEHNTKATQRLIELCLNWPQLQCFMHVSTIFCHPEIDDLEEKVYPFSKNPQKIMAALDLLDNEMIEKVAPSIITNHTNSYIFSKRVTETLLLDYKDKIPICIIRPSIVTPTVSEPFPGWVDSLNGPVGVLVGAGKGVIRTMICNENYHAEIVPVDYAIKLILVAVYCTAKGKDLNNMPVYNATQGKIIRVTWGEVVKLGRGLIEKYPFDLMLWLPGGDIRSSRLIHNLLIILVHYLPAYFVDMMMFLTKNKPFLVRIQNRISLGLKLLEYFTSKDWRFQNSNILFLSENLDDQDKKLFHVSLSNFDIEEYLKDMILGARKFCVKDPIETLPRAKKRLAMFKIADKLIKMFLIGFIFLFLYKYIETFCPKFNET